MITTQTIRTAPKGKLRIEPGLRNASNGDGTGYWQGRYRILGKDKSVAIGRFPEVGLKEARDQNARHRLAARDGAVPVSEKEKVAEQQRKDEPSVATFEEVARLAYADLRHTWKNGGERNGWMPKMEKHVFPEIGDMPLPEITGRVLADIVRPYWHDKHPTADKALIHISQVLGWAEAAEFDCDGFAVKRARRLLGKTRYKPTNYKAMAYADLPKYYASLGRSMADLALRFYILTVPRTSNATTARWDEIQGDLWHLPSDKMKRDDTHVIPLSDAALEVLELAAQFQANEGREGFILKSDQSWKTGHVSANHFSQQMRRLGLNATAHGFRATFKMWATMTKADTDIIIEEVLHHKVRGAVESAYLRGHLAELRRPIMDAWAKFVTSECAETSRANVISFGQRKKIQKS